MSRKIIVALAAFVLAVCLLSGGCKSDTQKLTEVGDWKNFFKINPDDSKKEVKPEAGIEKDEAPAATITVALYYPDASGERLVAEKRSIKKVEGIARATLEELLKGPTQAEHLNVFPEKTRLLDINVKEDGSCIVDLSQEAENAASKEQERLMVYSIVNTLSAFPSVKEVHFRVEGEDVETLAGCFNFGPAVKAEIR